MISPDYLNTLMNSGYYHDWCYDVKIMLLISLRFAQKQFRTDGDSYSSINRNNKALLPRWIIGFVN